MPTRETRGRPKLLNNPTKKLITLEPRHTRILMRLQKKHSLSGMSETVRFILDEVTKQKFLLDVQKKR